MSLNDRTELSLSTPLFENDAFTVSGAVFHPNDQFWSFAQPRNKSFDFRGLSALCSVGFLHSSKLVTKALLERDNLLTVWAAFAQFKKLSESIAAVEYGLDRISARHLSAWVLNDNNIPYIGQLRIFTNAAKTLNASLLDDEAQSFLDNLKISQARTSYSAVRSWNPLGGPYRPSEDTALSRALSDAFEIGKIDLREYFVCRMFRGFGMRPEQLTQMKVEDIREASGGTTVRIPMIKQRGLTARSRFMPWKPVSEGLALVIRMYLEKEIAPLVENVEAIHTAPLILQKRQLPFYAYRDLSQHTTGDTVQKIYLRVFRELNVISPITGEPIHVNPRRERHTFGTQLAMNGARAEEIAINLGQSNVESCEAYVDASVEHYQRMEELVGEAFIPIADRFLGKVLPAEDANADINFALYNKNFETVGSCSSGGCNALEAGVAPIACYTCRKFNAWANGPHETMLEMLLKEQENLKQQGHSDVAETKTQTIVAINDLLEAIRNLKSQ